MLGKKFKLKDKFKNTSTAFIEPACTREKYRKMGLCKEMLHGTINRLKK